MILVKIGTWFKGKDANDTGSDDVIGNLFIAAAPAVEAATSGNETAFKKGLKVTRDIIDGYLKT